jgi:hypothetical protein
MIINPLKSMDVITLKLSSSEEVVGLFVEKTDKTIKIRKPLSLSMTQNGPALSPYFITCNVIDDQHEIEFNRDCVVAIGKTFKPFADVYTQSTSGITLNTSNIKV